MIKNKYINLHFQEVNSIQRSWRRYRAFMTALKYVCAAAIATVWLWAVIAFFFAATPGDF